MMSAELHRVRLDLEALRTDTVGCEHRLHLNNAGAALMPRPVAAAIHDHLRLEELIGGYEAADAAAAAIDSSYESLGRVVKSQPRNIAMTSSATAAFVQALSSFDFTAGDVIVTSRCDYTSNQIIYLALAERLGVRVVHAADLPSGGIDPQSVEELIQRARPRLVAVSWVPTHSGLVQEVASVGDICARHDIPFIVDACQAVGQIPIDVAALHCDYLSGTARKFLRGPRGAGFLFASDRALARGDHPLFVDMRGARWVRPDAFQIAESAKRYEEWESAYALVIGQGAAADYALDVGIEAARSRAWMLAARLREKLAALDGVRVLDPGATRCAIVTADRAGTDARQIVKALSARGINTVVTLCEFGLLDLSERKVDAAVRISPHYYNSDEEIETFVAAFDEVSKPGARFR
jgi:selenocysteine lyase/cysteine desulfurase